MEMMLVAEKNHIGHFIVYGVLVKVTSICFWVSAYFARKSNWINLLAPVISSKLEGFIPNPTWMLITTGHFSALLRTIHRAVPNVMFLTRVTKSVVLNVIASLVSFVSFENNMFHTTSIAYTQ